MKLLFSQKLYSAHFIESNSIKLLLKEYDRNLGQTYISSIEKQSLEEFKKRVFLKLWKITEKQYQSCIHEILKHISLLKKIFLTCILKFLDHLFQWLFVTILDCSKQQQKHCNNVWNMFKVDYKDIRPTLVASFFSVVSADNFEDISLLF